MGLYANLIGLNAYHQPGVEAGKLAAGDVIKLSVKIQNYLKSKPGQKFDAVTISDALEESGKAETVYKLLQHLAANRRVLKFPGKDQFSSFFQACIYQAIKSAAETVLPCFTNEIKCLITDCIDVISKANTITVDLACIYHNELLLQIDNSNKTP